jgi:alkylation response protein AidB-like acyl-CoA dehydrogenase
MRRQLFEPEHEDFRESVRTFLEREAVPNNAEWERAGMIPREIYAHAAEHGFIGIDVPEEYGGAGVSDFRFNAVLIEECQRACLASLCMGLSGQNDLCLPYLLKHGSEAQKGRWLPDLVAGKSLAALALTEPGAGSDLAGLTTAATPVPGGWRVTGTKTFISNAIHCDLAITAVRTDRDAGRSGISLLVIERGTEGFERGRPIQKLGLHGQDTAELFFDDAFVPETNLLGDLGGGWTAMRHNLAQERLSIAVMGLAAARVAVEWTVDYVSQRRVFGQTIGSLQSARFTLAECRTQVEVAQAFVDQCCLALNARELSGEDAAAAKWWCTELQGTVIDRCLQLHGGYGYTLEYPIARAYADARVTRIYGGANEIMKLLIARTL